MSSTLLVLYDLLLAEYGRQHWWPASSPFEVIVGAILTQAVNWKSVEKSIAALKKADLLSQEGLAKAKEEEIAPLIRPCIYYNQKAAKLKAFVRFLEEKHDGNLHELLAVPAMQLRRELLQVKGIGQETADSIVLYAADQASFVIDAYTKRILLRLSLIDEKARYSKIRQMFMEAIPEKADLYKDYHALFVRHAKERCRARRPLCVGCPLNSMCDSPLKRKAPDAGH